MLKKLLSAGILLAMLALSATGWAQDTKKPEPPAGTGTPPPTQGTNPATPPKPGPKAYKDVITDKAKTSRGFFTVHKIDDKYYFEIADSLINREWMAIVRIAKTPNGIGYGGENKNTQTLRWEKGQDNKLYLRVVSHINVASDSLPINIAVKASNSEAIVGVFDVKAFSRDSSGVVIDVTDFLKGDNAVFTLTAGTKRAYGLAAIMPDRTFINSVRSFPMNTELRVTKTFSTTPAPNPGTDITDASNVGVVTMEINTSLVMLPKEPMKRRLDDERVGYFTSTYNTNYGLDAHRAEGETFINRWRLEVRPEDVDKMKRGELVEPVKPIVYYIDPATPVKWRKYLKMGIEDWQKAFEKAGFKNAIIAKDWPENDSSMSLEDVRFSMIRYFASDIQNAYGPQVVDPRSGEVIQSQIGWYHNVMQLLRNWYLIQAGAVDPAADKVQFDDDLMGQLIRFVSSHEVGHTIGLLHNFGASFATPVEKLRDKAWVEEHGHTSSIMDYARFNYVAQPEDHISRAGLFPRINDYDLWAIEFGYKPSFISNEYAEHKMLNKVVQEKVKNPRLVYLHQHSPSIIPAYPDPRAQNEDLGDDAMKASEYGIKNLKRILPLIPTWSKEEGKDFEQLDEMYQNVLQQFQRYVWHVSANIGGIYANPRTADQEGGEVYTPVPKKIQKDAMDFLKKYAFTSQAWLMDFKVLKNFDQDQFADEMRAAQESFVNNLLNTGRFARLIDNTAELGNNTYTLENMLDDMRTSIWSELYEHKTPDVYKRNLQKVFVERMSTIIKNPATLAFPPGLKNARRLFSKYFVGQMDVRKSDVLSVLKGTLRNLKTSIKQNMGGVTDHMTKYHYEDVLDRIEDALSNDNDQKK